jgi:hypothetical protein
MLNDNQYQQLLKPLNPQRVAKREQAGRSLSYLEAWDVKAHLIRIFGFGGWSWEVTEAVLAYEDKNERGQWEVAYKVVGTLTIHDLGCRYTEAAVGSASLPRRGEAHDMAIKTAESDGLKRAAINLGTQFGLSLYNDGTLKDVVGATLDRGQPAPLETQVMAEIPADNDASGMWIEQMAALVADKDIPALIEMQKDMKQQQVMDYLYQGQTLAKWLDRAMQKASA